MGWWGGGDITFTCDHMHVTDSIIKFADCCSHVIFSFMVIGSWN